jgi:hypothetical protein
MGRRYSSQCSAAVAASKSHQTIYQPASGVVSRPRIYDLILSSSATPNDVAIQFTLARTTAAPGTPVAITPGPIDAADAATEVLASKQATTEPTGSNGASLLTISLNQRITFRWVAAPLSELVIPATASYGISLFCAAISTGTPSMDSTIFFEQ